MSEEPYDPKPPLPPKLMGVLLLLLPFLIVGLGVALVVTWGKIIRQLTGW